MPKKCLQCGTPMLLVRDQVNGHYWICTFCDVSEFTTRENADYYRRRIE
jgi:hypothetical protein